MPKFIPLTMLKDTTGIVEFCQECGEPVFVARNGTPEMVIMSTCVIAPRTADLISGKNLQRSQRQSQSRN